MIVEKKFCTKCENEKVLDDFAKDNRRSDGRKSACKKCQWLYVQTWLAANPETKERYKDKDRAHKKQWYKDNKDAIRANRRFKKYGMTVEQHNSKLRGQDGKCSICEVILDGTKPSTHPNVDHDHKCCNREGSCGKCVRGLLCASCNHLLGQAKDSPAILLKAVEYLRFYQGDN